MGTGYKGLSHMGGVLIETVYQSKLFLTETMSLLANNVLYGVIKKFGFIYDFSSVAIFVTLCSGSWCVYRMLGVWSVWCVQNARSVIGVEL